MNTEITTRPDDPLWTSSFSLQCWHRKILTRTGCHFPAKHGDGDDKVGNANGKHGLDCSSRAAFIDLSKSREPANPPGRPDGQCAILPIIKDRIQVIKRNVNRSNVDRLIGSSRSLSRECWPIPISPHFEIRRTRVESIKITRDISFLLFLLSFPLFPSPSLLRSFFTVLIRIQIYSNA